MKSRFILFTGLVIAIFWLNALMDLRERRSDAIHEAERETSTLALTLEEQVLNSIGAADLTLRLIVRMAEENDWTAPDSKISEEAMRIPLERMAADVPQVNNLAIIDRNGVYRGQSVGSITGMTGIDRDYYLAHRRDPHRGLHISPAVRGRITGRNVVAVSRTIFDKNGVFAGVAVAAMNQNYFHKTYTAIDLGPNGAIALFDINGAIINRKPNPGNVISESAAGYPLFSDHLNLSPVGSYIATSPLDSHVRVVSYRQIATTPFIVAVGKSLSVVLEPWRREVWQSVVTLGVITLLMMIGGVVLFRETARRQQSQKSLEESERRFRSTFDRAPIGIGHLDLQGRWLLTNPALREILGYSEEELRELDMLTLTHPDDRAAARTRFETTKKGECDLQVAEKRYVRKDGEIVWVSLTASLQKDECGEPKDILSIVSDITSRKATEADLIGKSEQLRRSEEVSRRQALILESIIASMGDAVMVADEKRNFLVFNPAARKLFGDVSADGFQADACVERFGLYQPDMKMPLSAADAPLTRALRGEHLDSADIYVRNAVRPEGAFVSVSARPMTDDTGVIRGAVIVCRDITEARLTNEALRQAQKMEAVGQLTGGIAHDFNNLLQVILGNSEILVDKLSGNAPQQQLAQMTLTAAQRGAELTNQLLSFSRRQSLQPRPTDVRRLVAETEGLLSGAVGATIEIKQDFPDDLWQAAVDPGMLQSALVNLVLNARDAMPDGGQIAIRAENVVCDQAYANRHQEVQPGEYVRISVADTGTGIPAANLDRVFEPFFTTKDVGKGSGLGLSMVYGFIRQSGGAIRIRSIEGHGTVVRLYLPRAIAATVEPSAAPAGSVPEGHETILVVEDDPLVRDFVVAALCRLGYSVLAATDGDNALRYLRGHDAIDLLFTDIVMPGGMSGWELAKQAVALRPGLKLLFTSGYADTAGYERADFDLAPLLNKPYDKADLAAAVRRALAPETELVGG